MLSRPRQIVDDTSGLSTDELLRLAEQTAACDPKGEAEDRWRFVRELHRRSEAAVFRSASTWCTSSDAHLRCLGADVLGQLGFDASYPFAADSEQPLAALLDDTDTAVISSALAALGHLGLGAPKDIAALASHPSAEVRDSVAFCLGARDDSLSRDTLIQLSSDSDADVRNWATFGLVSLSGVDSPQIRDALAARLSDTDDEVRREAILGLAKRGDVRAVPAILVELQEEEAGVLAIEAAAALPDRSFVEALENLLESNPDDPDINLAVERCRAK